MNNILSIVKHSALRLGVVLALGATSLTVAAPAWARQNCSCSASCLDGTKCSTSGGSSCTCDCSGRGPGGAASCSGSKAAFSGDLMFALAAADHVALAPVLVDKLGPTEEALAVAEELLTAGNAFEAGDAGTFYQTIFHVEELLENLGQDQLDAIYELALALPAS